MTVPLGAEIVGRVTRRLPTRRWQAGHWLGKLLLPRGPFVGRFGRGRFEVHPGEVASMSAFLTGFYEREVTIWSLEQLRANPPALVVDVGANFGYYPLLFGLRSGGSTASIAFEPDPVNFAWLCRNLALNPELKVTPVQAAVGSIDGGTVPFETAKEGHNVWARVGGIAANEHAAAVVNVPSVTLDTYLDTHGHDTVPITLIDVEGYEAEVVKGMAAGIARRRYERVMIEYHPWAFSDPVQALKDLARPFLEAGYAGYRFRHHSGQASIDRDPAYFRLTWSDDLLLPFSTDGLSSWEHYLFIKPGSDSPVFAPG